MPCINGFWKHTSQLLVRRFKPAVVIAAGAASASAKNDLIYAHFCSSVDDRGLEIGAFVCVFVLIKFCMRTI